MIMNNTNLSVSVECEDCKAKFEITSGNLVGAILPVYKKKFNVNGQSIFLTYYDCPNCGRRHFVQIDNEESLEKLKIIQTMFVKFSVLKKNGKQAPKKQLAKFKKAQSDLSIYRRNLMKVNEGKTITEKDDKGDYNSFILRFSI